MHSILGEIRFENQRKLYNILQSFVLRDMSQNQVNIKFIMKFQILNFHSEPDIQIML